MGLILHICIIIMTKHEVKMAGYWPSSFLRFNPLSADISPSYVHEISPSYVNAN